MTSPPTLSDILLWALEGAEIATINPTITTASSNFFIVLLR
jgi:hypothetical protein